ncbi:MAG: PAS domain S-box protein, partial [Nitrospirota bacterium]|nr:PAS domain S-box protein [Nitrospirota bacterium]
LISSVVEGMIRAKKRAEKAEEEARFHGEIMLNMAEAVYLVSMGNGAIVYTNSVFDRMFGYEKGAMIGKDVSIVNAPGEKRAEETAKEIIASLKRDGSWEGEIKNIRKDGTVFWSHASVSLFNHSKFGEVAVSVHTDITERKETEEALRESEKKHRALFESSMDAMLVIAPPDWRYTSCNPAAVKLFRAKDIDDFLSVRPWELSPENQPSGRGSAEMAQEMIATALNRGTHTFSWVHKRFDGEEFPAMVAASMFEIGGQRALQAVIRDLTGARESEQEYATLLATTQDGFWEVDSTGRLVEVNDAYCKLTGYTREELLSMKISDIEANERPEETAAHIQKIIGTGYDCFETRHYRKDGSIIDIEVTTNYRKIKGGTFYAFIRDISQRKEAQQALLKARDEAEKAAKLKSDFLSSMSHEIRTPMNGIIGLTRLALETDLTPRQVDYLQKIQTSSTALLHILNDILDFQKIEAGAFRIETVAFRPRMALENCINLFRAKAEEKDITISYSLSDNVPDLLTGDPLRLGQVLNNLVGNAVKFTNRGEIVITAEVTERNNHSCTLRFSVHDTGIGISAEHLRKLFAAFQQAEGSISREYGGTGLGLAISRRLVNLMGGDICVDSEPGRGSEFIFTVKFGLRPEGEKPAGQEHPSEIDLWQYSAAIHGARILVVEDNEINRQVAAELLAGLGMNVSIADSGETALKMTDADTFDAILMDLQMPGMDGCRTAARILDKPPYKDVPIIVMSAAVMEEDKQRCFAAGMVDHVAKPIIPETLAATLVKWIKPVPGRSAEIPPAYTHEPATQEIPCIPADQPGFDSTGAVKRASGNRKLICHLLHDFANDFSSTAADLQQRAQTGDREGMLEQLHGLKGVAGMVGLTRISAIAAQLEHDVRSGATPVTLEELDTALNETFEFIAREVGKPAPASARVEPYDPEDAANRLNELAHYLDKQEIYPEESVTALISRLKTSASDAQISELARQLDRLDYKGALDTVREIARELNIPLAL